MTIKASLATWQPSWQRLRAAILGKQDQAPIILNIVSPTAQIRPKKDFVLTHSLSMNKILPHSYYYGTS